MKIRLLGAVALATMIAACDSPLDTDPTASIDEGTALSTPRGIELGVNGAYRSLTGSSLYGVNEMVYPDLYADNLDFTGTFQTDREVALRNITATNGSVLGTWQTAYDGINRANNLIDAIPGVAGLTDAEADRAMGDALFVRALHYSILNRYFGGVPLVLTPTRGVDESSLVSRNTIAEVWAQVITDLETALPLLPTGREHGRATQGAAQALLARVYLEVGNYAEARDNATAVINNTAYELNEDYGDNFAVKNSAESIFELQYSPNHQNSQAFWFFPQALGGRLGYAPSADLYNAFPAGDERRDVTIGIEDGQRYGTKYFRIANSDDNVIVLRLAEMYLIRAEANARLNAAPAVVRADIDILRVRAGLAPLAADIDTQTELLDAVLAERRLEYAMEGHRFFDLRRLGRAEAVLQLSSDRLLWPIPQAERDVNSNLEQNPGY
ncbi:MAG TPA: RagB/SusD family nutrient uptake outer membrane protein [Longimicrobiales bacterium]